MRPRRAPATEPSRRIVQEFTHQAEAFNRAPVMHSDPALADLVADLPAEPRDRWLDVACGTGIVARALAPRVREVVGVDLTPAMLDLARRGAATAGLHNAAFIAGDATALSFPDGTFDGAVTRFSIHHMPAAEPILAEMVRVVRPGGWVAVTDHVTSDDPAEAAWHNDIETLRDPSHVACLTTAAFRSLAARLGLTPQHEHEGPLVMDFAEWIARGSGGPANRDRILNLLQSRPPVPCFSVGGDGTLTLRLARLLWRKS